MLGFSYCFLVFHSNAFLSNFYYVFYSAYFRFILFFFPSAFSRWKLGSFILDIHYFPTYVFNTIDLPLNTTVTESHMRVCVLSCFSHVQLCEAMDCSPPGSSVHGILQARIPEWVAMPSFRGSSQPRGRTQVSRIAGGFFIAEPPVQFSRSVVSDSL